MEQALHQQYYSLRYLLEVGWGVEGLVVVGLLLTLVNSWWEWMVGGLLQFTLHTNTALNSKT